jgi:cytochrome c oxidase subunit 2
VRRTWTALLCTLAIAVTAAAGAYADNGGFTPPDGASPNAEGINDIFWALVGVTGFVLLVVEGALIWFVFRYRGRRRARTVDGPQIHGSTRLEQLWTLVPALLLAGLIAFTLAKLPGIKDVPDARAGDRLAVKVEGHQFYWRFVYPDGQVSVDRLVVPVGRVVVLELTAEDVIHSWWVPELGGKVDTIPGRTNSTWFQAKREGTYEAICAEFCGIQHTVMRGEVAVVSDSEYRAFLATHAPGGAAVGRESFEGACARCHGLAGEGDVGPNIQGTALLSDPAGFERLMREGQNRMPPVAKNWSDAQVKATIDYMKEKLGGG